VNGLALALNTPLDGPLATDGSRAALFVEPFWLSAAAGSGVPTTRNTHWSQISQLRSERAKTRRAERME
jgi:hypothetical protein